MTFLKTSSNKDDKRISVYRVNLKALKITATADVVTKNSFINRYIINSGLLNSDINEIRFYHQYIHPRKEVA